MADTAPPPLPPPPEAVGQALVDFAVRGLFPGTDALASAALTPDVLPVAVRALAAEKARLESEIEAIVAASTDGVRAWIDNAQALQVDMARRKTLATDLLVGRAAAGSAGQSITPDERDAEAHAAFLTGELNYSLQVRCLLEAIQRIARVLDDAEAAARNRRVLDALFLLERAWGGLDQMPVSKSCRAMRLLDVRAFELKEDVRSVLASVWHALLAVDEARHTLVVSPTKDGEPMNLADAAVAMQAYKETDSRMAELWHALDAAIVAPRMQTDSTTTKTKTKTTRPAIVVDGTTVALRGSTDGSVGALFDDLERFFAFLAAHLPPALLQSLVAPASPDAGSSMMRDVVGRLVDGWLAAAVPTSLDQMPAFEATLASAQAFCRRLAELAYTGFGRLQEWVENAPRVWLAKRREAALAHVRASMALGLGAPVAVEKIEKQTVTRSEGNELAAATTADATDDKGDDWDTAWSDEEPAQDKDDGADAWGAWGDDGDEPEPEPGAEPEPEPESKREKTEPSVDDDAADAWGWGDDDAVEPDLAPTKTSSKPNDKPRTKTTLPQTMELTLRETYSISSLPAPVLALIAQVLDDALALTAGDHAASTVATAAAGLFGIPALVLGLFRAVSPHYYALDAGGSMYLYNDAMYLAEQLAALVPEWTDRLTAAGGSAAPVARLTSEVAKLQGFASRAYAREMLVQKTVLRDLLGGDDSVLPASSQAQGDSEASDFVDAAVARVRSMAAAWHGVLAPSAWAQAVGALADAVAHKLILDVLDMPAIGQDDAFALASLIQKVTELDDLFVQGADKVPMTSQYAPNWLRLQYLSEVLQSNLREVRYLWMESELSLYFTVAEVLDLIKMSFEDNARAREVAREIAANPQPCSSV